MNRVVYKSQPLYKQISEITPKERHAAQELHNAWEREQSQSQVSEMNPLQVLAHRAQFNSPERSRAQQLGNENREKVLKIIMKEGTHK